jgi:hypothetical protein
MPVDGLHLERSRAELHVQLELFLFHFNLIVLAERIGEVLG